MGNSHRRRSTLAGNSFPIVDDGFAVSATMAKQPLYTGRADCRCGRCRFFATECDKVERDAYHTTRRYEAPNRAR